MDRERSPRPMYFARLVWIGLALGLIGLQAAGQAAALKEALSLRLTPAQVQALHAMGLSEKFYPVWVYSWQLPLPLFWSSLGLFIFWRKSNDWSALAISAMMVGFGLAGSIPIWKAFVAAYPQWSWLVLPAAFWGNICLNSFIFTFPNGRFAPRWTAAVAVGLSVANILLSYDFILPASVTTQVAQQNWLSPIFFLTSLGGAVLAPFYRYRWVATPVERAQIKLVVFTMVISIILFSLAASTAIFIPGNNPNNGDITFMTVFLQPLGWIGTFQIIALSLAVSILRYRLYDIDLIIRRTLVYGILTALLALVYFGGVTLLQSVFVAISGQQSPAALVISTLLIAALVNPLRLRIQEIIDRRFYRQKYNAERALAEFAAAARNEVELTTLENRLLNVVNRTLQPENIFLWIKEK